MTQEMKIKREELKGISRLIQQLVKAGRYSNVNEGLVEMYAQQGHIEIHSFKTWLSKGMVVRKGEKALLLWAEPRKAANLNKQSQDEKDEFKFFPLAYVFSDKQVEPLIRTHHSR